jgi:predicted Ser/Thr protein kinase
MTVQDQMPEGLGPYRVLERLGEGGMGVVYLAADSEHRRVAVKALRHAVANDPNARRRLAREVETMRRVRSPFVAEVLDADVTCEPPYIVTRYVSGQTLEEIVSRGGPLTGQALARVASGLAFALAAVHAAGVVHRDLKPGNVMLARGEPVVIDFGIAQVPDSTRLTMTGMFMGTPGYLAPEVIEGKQSGPASDVHSWGATVAFAATGRPPFGTGAFETIFYRIINGQADLDGFPAPLLSLVARALSRDPASRPGAAELCERTAALDPVSLVPVTAAAGAAPFGMPGTVADRPPTARPGTGRDGAATAVPAAAPSPVAPVAWPPGTRPLGAGAPAGGYAGQAGARPANNYPANNYSDVLPPVRYAPPATAPPPGQPGPLAGPAAQGATRAPAGPLLVAASIAALVSLAVILPIAGTVAALIVLMALRAVGQTADSLTRRHTRRGARASDPLLSAVVFPLSFAWSVARTLLLAPAALVMAALVAAITIIVVPRHPLALALAYGAGVLVAFYGIGPGSGSSRKPLRKFFDRAAASPPRAAIAFTAAAAVVIALVAIANSNPPVFWPSGHTADWLQHFQWLHSARSQLLRLIGRPGG